MTVSLFLAFSYFVLTIARLFTTLCAADISKYPGNGSLSVLLLTSSDPSYFSQPLILSEWVNDLLRQASENGSYELKLLSLDTQVYPQMLGINTNVNYIISVERVSMFLLDRYAYSYNTFCSVTESQLSMGSSAICFRMRMSGPPVKRMPRSLLC